MFDCTVSIQVIILVDIIMAVIAIIAVEHMKAGD